MPVAESCFAVISVAACGLFTRRAAAASPAPVRGPEPRRRGRPPVRRCVPLQQRRGPPAPQYVLRALSQRGPARPRGLLWAVPYPGQSIPVLPALSERGDSARGCIPAMPRPRLLCSPSGRTGQKARHRFAARAGLYANGCMAASLVGDDKRGDGQYLVGPPTSSDLSFPRRWRCRFFSAQSGQRNCPRMALFGQSLQSPDAFRRLRFSALSARSRPWRVSGVSVSCGRLVSFFVACAKGAF